MSQEKIVNISGNKPIRKVRLHHIYEVFSNFSEGDVATGENTVRYLNAAQMRNTREIISNSLKSVGRKSEVFRTMTTEVDPHAYDQTVGMTQKSEDGGTFVTTDVVVDAQGRKGLFSLAFTTKLREEVRGMLGESNNPKQDNLEQAA